MVGSVGPNEVRANETASGSDPPERHASSVGLNEVRPNGTASGGAASSVGSNGVRADEMASGEGRHASSVGPNEVRANGTASGEAASSVVRRATEKTPQSRSRSWVVFSVARKVSGSSTRPHAAPMEWTATTSG
ncbi:hypothetical protein GCM10009017_10700 [Halarchaeum rubridurum]|uniref:Uncharacterized protein n=1 Tax=Halarchaeum rubridurum TaxID=489911 RepID=A0A830FYW9_9EURY|nr:hypothetical protein GCM10009017_10700 [Halarchaeum rubridurum]